MPPSRRLQTGAVLFALLVILSLCLAPAPSWEWRLLAGCASFALAWQPVRAIIFQRGRAAVRRFAWAAEGTWRVFDRGAGWISVDLAPQTAAIGPWILLVWSGAREPGKRRRSRRYALIDAAGVGRTAFRTLRARLTLLARHAGRPVRGHDNC